MRILLTGSSGWLGQTLVPRLKALGHEVVGIDPVASPHTLFVGSIADRALVHRAVAEHGIEAIIHSGALHKPDIERHQPEAFIEVNVQGTLNLLEEAVAQGVGRFVFTSTTSLMISQAIRDGDGHAAVWLDETAGPLEPRNIYGVTKLAAEGLCRLYSREHGLNCAVLRTSRFFPEDDDTINDVSGENLKANELLYRRLTVEDAAEAHLVALEKARGFDTFIVSAPPPFSRADVEALKSDAADVIARVFPEAVDLYAQRGWRLPASIGRIYDPSKAERLLGFRARTDFAALLQAMRAGAPLPFAHDPDYVSPSTRLKHG